MKDESTCLRCAMCASRCPTHAITMQQFEFAWECVSIPAPNAKINYEYGDMTGADWGVARVGAEAVCTVRKCVGRW